MSPAWFLLLFEPPAGGPVMATATEAQTQLAPSPGEPVEFTGLTWCEPFIFISSSWFFLKMFKYLLKIALAFSGPNSVTSLVPLFYKSRFRRKLPLY